MSLTRSEVDRIAELAKLGLSEEEKEKFQQQLSAILEYADALRALDTTAIPPTATVLGLTSIMRPDEIRPSLPQEDVLANAPRTRDGYLEVKPINVSSQQET
ncbi:MAG: Asp-tRNA(Asn)/Glu-tRNA(Gln) amidotransferase subunit GatC [Chloroflexi bacterium]|nr:Asp-tRNA(Asn)/Glu-tRNA(Gln) amidotransferase subunit GatC [Chloroflexota bacterium]